MGLHLVRVKADGELALAIGLHDVISGFHAYVKPGYHETRKKVSAAWLVERSGFAKGFGSHRVGISSKHALAIINRGGATAIEVLALKDQIQHRVEEIWGIRLEPEPVMVGF